MGLGPGKGCVVGSPEKETRMDGTPLKARHPDRAGDFPPGRRTPARRTAGTRFLRRTRGLRRRSGTDFSSPLDFRRLRLPGAAAGRLLHLQGGQRIDHRAARPRRRDPRLPQCLPPSRLAHLQDRAGQRPPPGLPLSPLDLRARRLAGARHAPRVRRRQGRAVAAAGRDRGRGRAAVRLARATSAARLLRGARPPSGAR